MTVPALTFSALGEPVGQGNIRHFGKGRPSVHQNQERLLPWREHVQHCAEKALAGLDDFPLLGPVQLSVYFTVRKPVAAPKRRRTYPVKRPDLSHLVRAVEDALQAGGVFKDDSQVIDLRAVKAYPDEHTRALRVPGVLICVDRLEDPE